MPCGNHASSAAERRRQLGAAVGDRPAGVVAGVERGHPGRRQRPAVGTGPAPAPRPVGLAEPVHEDRDPGAHLQRRSSTEGPAGLVEQLQGRGEGAAVALQAVAPGAVDRGNRDPAAAVLVDRGRVGRPGLAGHLCDRADHRAGQDAGRRVGRRGDRIVKQPHRPGHRPRPPERAEHAVGDCRCAGRAPDRRSRSPRRRSAARAPGPRRRAPDQATRVRRGSGRRSRRRRRPGGGRLPRSAPA